MKNRNQSAAASEGAADRVRQNTSAEVNARLDREARERAEAYAARGRAELTRRIEELDRGRDVERLPEMNASAPAGIRVGPAAEASGA